MVLIVSFPSVSFLNPKIIPGFPHILSSPIIGPNISQFFSIYPDYYIVPLPGVSPAVIVAGRYIQVSVWSRNCRPDSPQLTFKMFLQLRNLTVPDYSFIQGFSP